jgi:lysophospholipase L1-like esterase
MSRLTNSARVAAAAAVVLAFAACESKTDILEPSLSGGNEMFHSYVALGNSITAGFQSNGINDSTQRQSYARLLAGQMGTQYHYASIAGRGCTPPIANTQTGALVGTGSTSTTCDLRAATSVTDILNNVAVPGARVLDPTSASTVASNALTTFILGGRTQVQAALAAEPTFATIWIGNNDVLQPGLSGLFQPIVSTQAQFVTAYDAMISQLLTGAPNLKGVLIGVAQVPNLPTMVSGALLFASPAAQAAVTAGAGKPVVIDASCNGSASLINIVSIIGAIRGNTHPATIVCSKGIFPAPVGDVYVLDAAEQTTLANAINAYNTYIKDKAAAIGFAYYDPNVLFAAKRANGEIPAFPLFNLTTGTFGPLISNDGIHPTGAAHKLIANELIAVINTKYGTALAPVP